MRLALVALIPAAAGLAATLETRVTGDDGRPAWARFEIHAPDGTMRQPDGSIRAGAPGAERRSRYLGSFTANGGFRINASPGKYRIVVERGLEYERIERTAEVKEDASLDLRPRRWANMRAKGWWSGDLHVHRPMADVPALLQAEDLNYGAVFTMWNRTDLWAGKEFPSDPARRVTAAHWMTVANAEDERGGGAWMLHQLRKPLGLEKFIPAGVRTNEVWTPPGIEFVRQARARKTGGPFPWFDLEKPIWWETPLMMALETPDSIGMAHNHLNQYGVLDNEAWARPRDTAKFPGPRGMLDYSLSLLYRYWNLGLRVPPSAGSASGVLPNPPGYNRAYVKIDGEFTVEKWHRGLRDGRSFVTNGPLLEWELRRNGDWLEGSVRTSAREPIEGCELVAGGEVAARTGASGRFRVPAGGRAWAAIRCFLRTQETPRFAHTAPLFLDGKQDASADSRYFAEWMAELMEKPAARSNPGLMELYRQARDWYTAR